MSTKATPTDLPTHSFPTSAAFETFLSTSHLKSPGIYLKFAKKSSGIPSILPSEAVELALCYGWIDGRANSLNDKYWTVRYTPRRPKSIWSQKNVKTVARLIEEGRMQPTGLVAVEAAKTDGRWERAYAGSKTIEVPDDLRMAMAERPDAGRFFEGLNKTDRYSVLWRVQIASLKGRAKRVEGIVGMLAEGKVPGERAAADQTRGERKRGKRSEEEVARSGKRRRDENSQRVEKAEPQSRRSGLRPRSGKEHAIG